MSMPRYTTIADSYQQAERECLDAWGKREYIPPMPARDQAIIVAAASRLLYNCRQRFPNTHGLGGGGAVEAALQVFKVMKIEPVEFAERLDEDD